MSGCQPYVVGGRGGGPVVEFVAGVQKYGGISRTTQPLTSTGLVVFAFFAMAPFLAILAIYRNECAILGEWLSHHLWQGFEAFYLIDNGSSPLQRCDHILNAYHPHVQRFFWPHTPHSLPAGRAVSSPNSSQVLAYMHAFPSIQCEWLLIADLDEVCSQRLEGAAHTPLYR